MGFICRYKLELRREAERNAFDALADEINRSIRGEA